MERLSRHFLHLLALFIALLAVLELASTHVLLPLENRVSDYFVRAHALQLQADRDIVIVDIDEKSLAVMAETAGSWPWPRAVHGELVEAIERQHPAAIVFDIQFADPDIYRPESDAFFNQAIAPYRNIYFPMVRLDPQYRIQFGHGGRLDCTPDLARMEQGIAGLSPGDVPGLRRFLEENRAKLAAMEPCLETPFQGWGDLAQSRLLRMLPMLRPHQSAETYLTRVFQDERVRLAFCFQSKYLGMSPFRCPSLFSILSFLEYEHGVWHPIGGCAAVSEAMARVAARPLLCRADLDRQGAEAPQRGEPARPYHANPSEAARIQPRRRRGLLCNQRRIGAGVQPPGPPSRIYRSWLSQHS